MGNTENEDKIKELLESLSTEDLQQEIKKRKQQIPIKNKYNVFREKGINHYSEICNVVKDKNTITTDDLIKLGEINLKYIYSEKELAKIKIVS
jgi:hypothetical protein